MLVLDIEPVYYARDRGTGVALIRSEDKPPRGALIDFMRGHGLVKPGAVVPVAWLQLWDYHEGQEEVPSLFSWPEFKDWINTWPSELDEFKAMWRRHFGMPHDDLADAAVIVWEEHHSIENP
jgi:hypothetical protein